MAAISQNATSMVIGKALLKVVVSPPSLVEFHAILLGLHLALRQKIPKLVLESNSLSAINILNRFGADYPERLKAIFWTCKLLSFFESCGIGHVRCSGNAKAYILT